MNTLDRLRGTPRTPSESLWKRHWLDLAIALALAIVAILVRRHGLPTDGLWLDDSITGAAVRTWSPGDFLALGADHPGYIVLLTGWTQLAGGDEALAYPALVAGVLGAPLLFLALRALGYDRAIAALLGAALVAAGTDIVYSGRVRTYTADVLIVLALALVVPRLARMRWSWAVAAAWVVISVVLATFSAFALVAVATAGVIMVLHQRSDLPQRLVAVGAQAIVTGALALGEAATIDTAEQERQLEATWDAYLDFNLNPVHLVNEAIVHLRRVAEVFPGGPEWLAMLCVLVALTALIAAAIRGSQAVRARYLVALLLVGLIGGFSGHFPFGPAQSQPLSDGGRWSLWLIPVVAIGLAVALQAVRRRIGVTGAARIGFDVAAYAGAVALLVTAGPALEYPFPGAKSATEFVESELGPDDAVLIPAQSNWSFAAESDFDVSAQATPDSTIGFQPEYSDPRLHYLGGLTSSAPVDDATKGADRVFVYYAEHPFSDEEAAAREDLSKSLSDRGLALELTEAFDDARVEVWSRDAGVTLQRADLPHGYQVTPTPIDPIANAIFSCLDVPTTGTTPNVVTVTGPTGASAIADITVWPSAETAGAAFDALSGPDATRCLEQLNKAASEAVGGGATVRVTPSKPPPAAGNPAVAYELTVRGPGGQGVVSTNSVFAFVHGRATGLIYAVALDDSALPPRLVASLVAKLAQGLESASPPG